MKSPVAGKSGSVRFMHLKPSQLKLAEDHGKRLDERSQARMINQDPPLTTTGLDLVELYERHIAGAKLHGGKKRVIHINFQFPDELVDGDDGPYMLKHACEFVEAIFGDEAIFANRLDRDEKGRKNVDIFVAPKYLKHTKKGSHVWVSTSRDLKELAKAYRPYKDEDGNPITTPKVCGQALQDALHEYFMRVMELPGVERGSPKLKRGSDWKDAEQLRMEELAEAQAKADALIRDLQNQQEDVSKVRAELEAYRNQVRIANEDAARDKALAASELAKAKSEAAIIRRDAQQEREREAAEAQQIRERLAEGLANVPQVQAEMAEALEEAEAERFKAVDERRAAARLRAEAEEEKRRVEEQHRLEERQRALLKRATDDAEGLNLRTKGETFEMNTLAMTVDEKDVYGRKWSKALIALARSMARMLERLREAARELLASRQEADRHMAEAKKREVEAEQRERQLTNEQKELADQKRAFERDKASHRAKAEALREIEASIAEKSDVTERWTKVIALAVESPAMFDIAKAGDVSLSELGREKASAPLRAFMQTTPPEWVPNAVKRLAMTFAVMDQKTAVFDQENAKVAAKEAALTEMIARAGPILSAKQKEAVSEAKKVMTQFGTPPPGVER